MNRVELKRKMYDVEDDITAVVTYQMAPGEQIEYVAFFQSDIEAEVFRNAAVAQHLTNGGEWAVVEIED